MKKTVLFLAIAMLAGSMTTVQAKNDKKKKNVAVAQQVVRPQLTTTQDTLSYAAGVMATNGLMPYLKQQFGVDSTNIDVFVQSFEESMGKAEDPLFKAKMAGQQIADMVKNRIFPQISNDLKDTKDSLSQKMFQNGFLASLKSDTTYFKVDAADKFFRGRVEAIKEAQNAVYKKENEEWLKRNATKDGIKTTASGLQYKVLKAGNGAVPQKSDKVVVKYEGRMIDGTVFDSSYKRNPQTSTFRCDEVIKGWTEALTMMPVGSKWELCIPQELAYGNRPAGKIKPYSTLVFTVELVSIEAPEKKEDAKSTVTPTKTPIKKVAAKKVGTKKK